MAHFLHCDLYFSMNQAALRRLISFLNVSGEPTQPCLGPPLFLLLCALPCATVLSFNKRILKVTWTHLVKSFLNEVKSPQSASQPEADPLWAGPFLVIGPGSEGPKRWRCLHKPTMSSCSSQQAQPLPLRQLWEVLGRRWRKANLSQPRPGEVARDLAGGKFTCACPSYGPNTDVGSLGLSRGLCSHVHGHGVR